VQHQHRVGRPIVDHILQASHLQAERAVLRQQRAVGLQVRRLQDVVYDWPPHAVLVLHSDGIVSRWSLADTPGLLQADPAVIAGWIARDHLRGRDDATVVVVRRHEGP